MVSTKNVAIIGSGIAGIATAIRLANKGYEVDVYEKNSYPGGKLSHFEINDFQFDAGPSLFTQPENVEELFRICGETTSQYFNYTAVNIACRYFFESGKVVNAYVDNQKFADELKEKLGENPDNVIKYLNDARKSYDSIGVIFLDFSLHKIKTFFQWRIFKAFANTKLSYLVSSMHDYNENAFDKKETIQIFNRFATYNGSNPYVAPAMLTMIPHLEQNQGTYYPVGGMISITKALYQLATKQGVKFHFGKAVASIHLKNNTVHALSVDNKVMTYDKVVSNMDVYYTYKNLLNQPEKAQKVLQQERSSSAVIFYWGIQGKFDQLHLHNICFSSDYKAEFDNIFIKKTISEDPTIYINITSKMEASQAPAGCENWFVMVNAPHDDGQDWDDWVKKCRKNVIQKLNRILATDLENMIVAEDVLNPKMIEVNTSSYTGSLYGTSSNSLFAAFFRHPNFARKIQNLYFVGGSVHPGGGIPLCLKSAKIAAEMI